jgi:hypothetical protein
MNSDDAFLMAIGLTSPYWIMFFLIAAFKIADHLRQCEEQMKIELPQDQEVRG